MPKTNRYFCFTIFASLEKATPVQVSVLLVVIVNRISSFLGRYSHLAEYSQVLLIPGLQFLGTFHSPPHRLDSCDAPPTPPPTVSVPSVDPVFFSSVN